MGKSSKKCKENRLQRKEEIARIAKAQAIVNAAKKQDNPLEKLSAFKKFSKDGLEVTISFCKAPDMDQKLKTNVMDLMRTNMKEMYTQSDWGWKEKEKSEELFDEDAWYILANDDKDGSLVAFSHFRFDMDEGLPVLYCYELQLHESTRRKGLGRRMMQILEMFSWQANMEKVVLTILKNNPDAKEFFTAMKYVLDESTPDEFEEPYCYEILSKERKIKAPQ